LGVFNDGQAGREVFDLLGDDLADPFLLDVAVRADFVLFGDGMLDANARNSAGGRLRPWPFFLGEGAAGSAWASARISSATTAASAGAMNSKSWAGSTFSERWP
jgi:hypothetical protein